ncbi:choice-of-anchor J domain-containing protein [Mesonia mobilis]|uniref:DUF5017 domain-containing protein n=1 Tax=Mesonia mobilis TaxID=369791 RepID=A0ABQ3BRF6_9FLAO|nr:choice-of-anchor J domain-containing protein [Mesonia mobilis]MBQ0738480.1 choice-of-anchor J domain-containing protein [Aquimarina celericrescens]GGZ55156.1 hypothetical protein GCM10008088_15900 [Mesonia mobilis]
MKKLVYLSIAMLFFLMACEPMEDIHEEIDAIDNPVVGEEEYTLTADDYESLELEGDFFETEDQARDLVPDLLAEMYPYWGRGSSVLVNYNLYYDQVANVAEFTNAEEYELESDDYTFLGFEAAGFYPGANIEEGLIDILTEEIDSPEGGDVVLAVYDEFIEEPEIGSASLVEYNFQNSFEGWTTVNVSGPQEWTSQSSYIEGNGYSGGAVANEDWIVSPEIDLTDETDVNFQISQAINYADDLSLLQILVSTDYSGDVTTATWDEINLQNAPAGDSNDFILSEEYDFSAYDGQTLNIALKYQSTNDDAGRWRVESLALKVTGVTGESVENALYFRFVDGEWERVENAYYLSASDYDEMGAPGQYNNFSSSVLPENYLPTFLANNFPYAQEEDEMYLIYRYYAGSDAGTQTRGSYYTFMSGMWQQFQSSLQFGFDGETWVPDNTITYLLTGAEYDYVAEQYESYVDEETGTDYSNAASNLANYGNFNRSGSPTAWDDDMMFTVLTDLLANVIAPNAEDGQQYVLNVDTYNGGSVLESFRFIKENGEWVENEE